MGTLGLMPALLRASTPVMGPRRSVPGLPSAPVPRPVPSLRPPSRLAAARWTRWELPDCTAELKRSFGTLTLTLAATLALLSRVARGGGAGLEDRQSERVHQRMLWLPMREGSMHARGAMLGGTSSPRAWRTSRPSLDRGPGAASPVCMVPLSHLLVGDPSSKSMLAAAGLPYQFIVLDVTIRCVSRIRSQVAPECLRLLLSV